MCFGFVREIETFFDGGEEEWGGGEGGTQDLSQLFFKG